MKFHAKIQQNTNGGGIVKTKRKIENQLQQLARGRRNNQERSNLPLWEHRVKYRMCPISV